MKIAVFSKSKTINGAFPALKKNGGDEYLFFPATAFAKEYKKLPAGSLVYLDADSFDAKTLSKNISLIAKQDHLLAGIFDAKGSVIDPASFFFAGASDYIGKDLVKKKFSAGRFADAASFAGKYAEEGADISLANAVPVSGSDWKSVKSGKEYQFCFLFVEMDGKKVSQTSTFGEQTVNASELFRKYVESQLKGSGGKVWMWMDNGGLILFPFDGRSCPAISSILRLVLNRIIFCVDESIFNQIISMRIAMHIGSTMYRDRGDTGKIVSDSINFIFHLGQKRAEPGTVYVTEEIKKLLPPQIDKMFGDEGTYEGRTIFKMKKLQDIVE
jgi:hypothetical protein